MTNPFEARPPRIIVRPTDGTDYRSFPTDAEWRRIRATIGWSQREASIVHCLARGYPRKRVAHLHGISKSTLQTYLQRAFRKLDTESLILLIWHVADLSSDMRGR